MDEQITNLSTDQILSNLGNVLGSKSSLSTSEQELQQRVKTLQGRKPSDAIDASRVGQGSPKIPTIAETGKIDTARAKIATTPEPQTSEPVSSNDFFNQLFQESGIDSEMANKFTQALDEASGGKFQQAGQNVLQNLLGAQVDQASRKKETARLQEKAGLPELQSEFAALQGEADVALAARDSRIINETGGQTTISKRTIANRQNEIQRQYGLQVADNRISQLAVAGQINAATQLIDAKMDLKYGDIEAEIDLYKSQLDAIQPFMDAEQKQLAEQRQFVLNQAQAEITSKRESEKQLELTKVQALQNARDRGASALEIARIQDAQSMQEIAATGYLTSAMDLAQLEGQRLSNLKTGQDISGTTGEVGGTIGAISTLLGVTPERLIETPDGQNAFVFKDAEPEKADKELVSQMFSAIGVVDRLEEQYQNAVGDEYSGFGSGVVSRLKGLKRSVGSFFGTNQEFTAYDNLRDSNLAIISRGLKGEKGNLSDQDIKRAKKALPGRFSSPLEAQRAFDDLRAQVRDSISLRGDIKPINEILMENLSEEQIAELQAEGLI